MERLIRLEEVKRMTSLSESDIRRRIKAKEFPEAVRLGPKRVAWALSEIRSWIKSVTGIDCDDAALEYDPISMYRDRISEQENGCWVWTGAHNDWGYGRLKIPGTRRITGAHRVIYEAMLGPIPEDMEIDHKCRVTMCVNPGHMEPVTRKENMVRSHRDRDRKLKTHCKRGHEYTPENTRINKRGNRHCIVCEKIIYQEKKRNANN